MKLLRTAFPNGTILDHNGEILDVKPIVTSYYDDERFREAAMRSRKLSEQTQQQELLNLNTRNETKR